LAGHVGGSLRLAPQRAPTGTDARNGRTRAAAAVALWQHTRVKQATHAPSHLPTGDDDLSKTQWSTLTTVPEKRRAYAVDLWFRECWADVVDVLAERATHVLYRTAVLSLKPDAVVSGRAAATLQFLADHGFRPLTALPFRLNRHSMRAVWQFDWNVYTADRLAFSTVWYTAADSLAFVLEDVRPRDGLPASVRLATLKGFADPARRNPDHLRTVLQPPNKILNFVHITDEPADLVRELGIWFDRPERRRLLRDAADRLGSDRTAEVRAVVEQVEAEAPRHDLDLEQTLARLRDSGQLTARGEKRLRQAATGGPAVGWTELTALLPLPSDSRERWDFVCVASHVLQYERDASAALLPPVDPADWCSSACASA